MNKYKSALSIWLAIILITSVFSTSPLTALAESSPSIVAGTVSAKQGQKNVEVTVSLKNNPGVASVALDIQYDDAALTLTGFTYNTEALKGASTVPFNETAKPPCLSMVNGTENITGDIVFATLTFDVSDKAKGSYEISFKYDPDNIYDIEERNIDFKVTAGKITIDSSTDVNTEPTTVKPTSSQTEPTAKPTEPSSQGTVFFNPGVVKEDLVWYAWTWDTGSTGKWVSGIKKGSNIEFKNLLESVLFAAVTPENADAIDWKNVVIQTEDLTVESGKLFVIKNEAGSINGVGAVCATGEWIDSLDSTTPTEPSESSKKIDISDSEKFLPESNEGFKFKYTGKYIYPNFYLYDYERERYVDCDIYYYDNLNVGLGYAEFIGKGDYTGKTNIWFEIIKAKQPMKVTGKTKSASASKLRKSNVKIRKAITVKKAKGSVTYKKAGGLKYLTISKKGIITVKKGRYYKNTVLKIKVKVTAKGTKNYKKGSKTVTAKIKIK